MEADRGTRYDIDRLVGGSSEALLWHPGFGGLASALRF